MPVSAFGATVRVEKDGHRWKMLVDGKPFFVKGVGCDKAFGRNGEDYLKMARQMGANTVRTWGAPDIRFLNRARKLGLKVNAGVWLNPVAGNASGLSYADPAYRRERRREILRTIFALKDHPALLTWNVGNEVFAFTDSEEERAAFGSFLNETIRWIHEIDPDHPVVYAGMSAEELPYLVKHVPELDVIGVNVYGTLSPVREFMAQTRVDKPVLVTEFGPHGAWDRPRDANAHPVDPLDQNKAMNYAAMWKEICEEKTWVLGGFAFVLGDQRNQDSLTWFNVNIGRYRRQAYWTLYSLYTGRRPANRSPKITSFKIDQVEAIPVGGMIEVAAPATDPDGDPISYRYFLTDIASDPLYPSRAEVTPLDPEPVGAGRVRLTMPTETGVYRLYVMVSDGRNNAAVANRSVSIVAPPIDRLAANW